MKYIKATTLGKTNMRQDCLQRVETWGSILGSE